MKKLAFASIAALALAIAGLGLSTNAEARSANGSHGFHAGSQAIPHSSNGNALPSGTHGRTAGAHGNQFRYFTCHEHRESRLHGRQHVARRGKRLQRHEITGRTYTARDCNAPP